MSTSQQPTGPKADPTADVGRARAPTPLGDVLRRLAAECDRVGAESDRCHTDPQSGNLIVESRGAERV